MLDRTGGMYIVVARSLTDDENDTHTWNYDEILKLCTERSLCNPTPKINLQFYFMMKCGMC